MVPVNWPSLSALDRAAMQTPPTFVKWIVDIAVTQGYINPTAPGLPDKSVQYNDGGVFTGVPGFNVATTQPAVNYGYINLDGAYTAVAALSLAGKTGQVSSIFNIYEDETRGGSPIFEIAPQSIGGSTIRTKLYVEDPGNIHIFDGSNRLDQIKLETALHVRSFGLTNESGIFHISDLQTNTRRITIGNFGRVGIGISSPGYKLDVGGDINLTGALYVSTNPGNVGDVLTSQGFLPPIWTPASGGVTGLSAFGSTPNANGATLTGTLLNLEPADGTHPGGISLSSQIMGAGAKTFASHLYALGDVGVGISSPASHLDVNTNAIGVTQTNTSGILSSNNTAATVGLNQYSPATRWRGSGWKTNATAGSQTVDFRVYVETSTGTTAPTGKWKMQSSINGGAYNTIFDISNSGTVNINGTVTASQVTISSQLTISAGAFLSSSGSIGTAGQVLYSNGIGSSPSWAALPTKVSTVTGPQVDNSDPINPVVNTPTLDEVVTAGFHTTQLIKIGGLWCVGGIILPQRIETGNYVIALDNYVISSDNTGSPVTITLPDATTCTGQIFIIKRYSDTSSGVVTIDTAGGSVQDLPTGAFGASTVLNTWGRYDCKATFQSNGTDWEYIQ